MGFAWQGTLVGIQPRIRLTRSFDERSHTYLGYALRLDGAIGDRRGEFLVGIGSGTQAKHRFRAGDVIQGESDPVPDPRGAAVTPSPLGGGPTRAASLPGAGSSAARREDL
jgi:hypothetical protein